MPAPPPVAPHRPAARARLQLSVSLDCGGEAQVPAITFDLLRRLARTDSLREAASGLGFSYRYAWGLLRGAEAALGTTLVETRRGQGTRLTAYGAMLAAALEEIESQLSPELDAATRALTAALALRPPA